MRPKILFPTEFGPLGEKARLSAVQLAKTMTAELVVMHSVEKHNKLVRLISGDDFEAEKKDAEAKLLEYATAMSVEAGIPVSSMIWEGAPAESIVETAEEIEADLIIFGTVGGHGLKDTLLGSAVNHVIRHAPCPVLTIRNKPQKLGFSRILVPIDTMREASEQVAWGVKMAKLFEAEIHFFGLVTGDADHNRQLDVRLRNSVKFARSQGLEEVEMHLDPLDESTEEEIETYAETIHADLICLLTQSDDESGLGTLLSGGSVADRVVNMSKFPVLSVTPTH